MNKALFSKPVSSSSCRLWGEPVNLREQHDALEFFNSLVDSLDEALKALGHPAMLSKVLGGSFADQKICQGCPHRYIGNLILFNFCLNRSLCPSVTHSMLSFQIWMWGIVYDVECRYQKPSKSNWFYGAVCERRLARGCKCLSLWKMQQEGVFSVFIYL